MKYLTQYLAKHATHYITCCIAGMGILVGCTKDVEYTVDNEGTIYMAQAYENKAAVILYAIDSVQDINFGASYGGLNYPSADIPVTFEVDKSLISTYNEQHGTHFISFPESAYTISGLNSSIRSGKVDSDPLKIAVSANELELGQGYMLPIKLTAAGSSTIDSSLSIAYFRIDSLVRRERDVTQLATLSVSNENNGGSGAAEGSPKLVDGDLDTKYLTQTYASGMWFRLKFASPHVLGAYTFTSGNDADARDPKTWRLEASNDGNTWTTLDTRTDESFTARTLTRRFEFENTEAYTYYRIVLLENNGDSLFQMSEWRLIEYY
ncbi:BT_3987 domain-containing protein [Olivibacter ginsenosidimutans]